MVKFHSSPVVVDEASTAIQKLVGVPADAVLFCQRFGTEIAVRLGLVQSHNALFTAHKSRTVLAQFVLNFRLVDFFNLFSFGGDVGIEET